MTMTENRPGDTQDPPLRAVPPAPTFADADARPAKATLPYRAIVAGIHLLVAVVAVLSMRLSIAEIDADIANIARERGLATRRKRSC